MTGNVKREIIKIKDTFIKVSYIPKYYMVSRIVAYNRSTLGKNQ